MKQCVIKFSIFLITGAIGIFSLAPITSAQQNQKSPAKAFFYSLVIPGLGQRYVENVGNARYMIGAEALLLGLVIGHEKYSDWLEEDYRAFAVSHAGINPAGKDKNFYVTISGYNSIYLYNERMRINRNFDKVIPETPENIWVWESPEHRRTFHLRRVDADKIQNRTLYFYAGIFLNHMVSGIHAAIKAQRHNQKSDSLYPTRNRNKNWSLRFITSPYPENPAHFLKLTFRF